jgi:glycosyltransferase involved in cell wall biosynthesis
MPTPKIIVHCLVKNEERFIWYALKSVLPFVDKIMVWDTGSTDNTVEIIKSINSKKINLKFLKSVNATQHTNIRQQMLEQTPKGFTWLMILDGDEIWPETQLKKVIQFISTNPHTDSVVVRTHNLVGDIYHRLPESAGNYQLAGQKGHLALRFINLKSIPNLHVSLPHGQQGFLDKTNTLVQNRSPKKIKFINVYYHHATHLQRSSSYAEDSKVIKRAQKLKTQLGKKIPPNQIPEVFFASHPKIIPSVTQKAPPLFWLKALVITPLKIVKRWLFSPKSGY